MDINKLLQAKRLSKYRLAIRSGVPYMTLSDICSGKTNLGKCSAETVYRLSKELDVTMEQLVESYVIKRPAFDLFKSNVCHRLKELGDVDFLIEMVENNDIRTYYTREWYPECLYLLAMVDYISRENNVPICEDYDDLRKLKLPEPLYPSGILLEAELLKDEGFKERALKKAIPEFLRFNIVESNVRDAI